jgi:cell division protein ZapA (FtsZ GTPase activity inhibitor)
LPTLRQLAAELVGEEELAKAATQAADYLDNRLAQMSQRNSVVAFRGRIAANVEQ